MQFSNMQSYYKRLQIGTVETQKKMQNLMLKFFYFVDRVKENDSIHKLLNDNNVNDLDSNIKALDKFKLKDGIFDGFHHAFYDYVHKTNEQIKPILVVFLLLMYYNQYNTTFCTCVDFVKKMMRITCLVRIGSLKENDATPQKVQALMATLTKGVPSLFSFLHGIGQMNKVHGVKLLPDVLKLDEDR